MPSSIERLRDLLARLRDPQGGCPWDVAQNFESLAPYTLEEAYEVVEALESGDPGAIAEELGDLLLQVVFLARLGEEAGLFDFESIAAGIADKLVRRHPHVFAGRVFQDAAERQAFWEESKRLEKAERGHPPEHNSLLGQIPRAFPALMEAQKLQDRAARVGFDWPSLGSVLDKLDEEIAELKAALSDQDRAHSREELGDVLFVLANVARHLDLDAEGVLRAGNLKFRRRFGFIEGRLAERGLTAKAVDLAELERLWQAAKLAERPGCAVDSVSSEADGGAQTRTS